MQAAGRCEINLRHSGRRVSERLERHSDSPPRGDSIPGGLLLVVRLQIDPGNVRNNRTTSVEEPHVGRLHEGIDAYNFEDSLMTAGAYVIAPFRWKNLCFRHFFTSVEQDNYGGVCSLAAWMSSSIRMQHSYACSVRIYSHMR